jgi:hypothetical protein
MARGVRNVAGKGLDHMMKRGGLDHAREETVTIPEYSVPAAGLTPMFQEESV